MAKKHISVSINRKNKTTAKHYAEINVPKKAKVVDLCVLFNEDPQILFEVNDNEDVYETRHFLSIKVGEELPSDLKLNYIGASVVQNGHVFETVHEILK